MSPGANGTARPTAKRSPSILVTDARTNLARGTRAPFAGQNFRKQQLQLQQQQSGPGSSGTPSPSSTSRAYPHYGSSSSSSSTALHKRLAARANKYTDISVDKLLSNLSDIPSGQSRLPLLGQGVAGPLLPPTRSMSPPTHTPPLMAAEQRRRNVLAQHLPPRTSKHLQRLVLIPDEHGASLSGAPGMGPFPRGSSLLLDARNADLQSQMQLQFQLQRSRAELMPKDTRAKEFSRVTAYYICEEFNLDALMAFLEKNHNVTPRAYDEALYVPYTLPLLPGTEGLRVKSNDSAKALPNKRYMEQMITQSEQTDHLYEYYSGVETPEDANNYSMDPENSTGENSGPFDPSEPQFFAPPVDIAESDESTSPIQQHLHLQYRNQDKDNLKHKEVTTAADTYQTESLTLSPRVSTNNNTSTSTANNITNTNNSNNTTPNNKEKGEDHAELLKYHAEMFVLQYGIVVFWNLSETHEKNILADLAFASEVPEPILINPISEQDIETEEFHFDYDPQLHRPRIFNDMITLRSGDHLIKLTMSHAIAQLTKLGLFESRMVHSLQLISKLPKKLALTGRLGLTRQQLLKKSGKLFKLRVDVNLLSSILDTPEFFWSMEPALHPLYSALREYLEIEQRVQVLNDRCKVFLEFLNIISDSINESSTTRITLMIIVIIFISLGVSVFEFFLEII